MSLNQHQIDAIRGTVIRRFDFEELTLDLRINYGAISIEMYGYLREFPPTYCQASIQMMTRGNFRNDEMFMIIQTLAEGCAASLALACHKEEHRHMKELLGECFSKRGMMHDKKRLEDRDDFFNLFEREFNKSFKELKKDYEKWKKESC